MLGSRPWRPPQDLPRTGPFAIEIVLKVRQSQAPFQNRDSIGNPVLQASLVPPWCLPGASQAVQLILSCLPGASRLSKWFFPATLVPPWCLADCPIDPVLPPWCLASCPTDPFLPCWCLASCPMCPFLPPWCLSGCPNDPFLPPWRLPVKGNSVCAGQPAVAPTPGFAANRAVRH